MDSSHNHKINLDILKYNIIRDIATRLMLVNANHIEMNQPIIRKTLGSEDELIAGITYDEKVFLDCNEGMSTCSLSDLSIEHLIDILKILELNQYRIEENID
jgi:hypothetical protein